MKCASCHDSFINDWKLTDAYGLAAIIATKPLEMHRCDKPTGEIAKPWVPASGQIDVAESDRRAAFVQWLTAENNPLFPRMEVNRIWA